MHKENLLSHNWLVIRANNDFLRRCLPLPGVIYDFGCGTRPYEEDFLEHADRYIGVDWSNTPHKLKADIVADLNKPLPIANEVADHVVSFQVLEHLSEPQVMLREAHRILRPEGTLRLAVPFQWWIHEEPWDFCRYTRYGLSQMLAKAGFSQVQIEESSGFWAMWFLKLNYQTLRIIRGPFLVRRSIRWSLVPFWWANQRLAPLLDRHWAEPRETAGYYVTAKKI